MIDRARLKSSSPGRGAVMSIVKSGWCSSALELGSLEGLSFSGTLPIYDGPPQGGLRNTTSILGIEREVEEEELVGMDLSDRTQEGKSARINSIRS